MVPLASGSILPFVTEQPGRYMLAVECDGATYHSALWARERDRLRQEVLENMGWRFHRIWLTDWFYRRGETIQRLKAALEEAEMAVPKMRPKEIAGARQPTSAADLNGAAPTPAASGSRIEPYQLAECAVPRGVEPHEAPVAEIARIVTVVVEIEGPIHQEEVARRVTSLFGKSRTGSRIDAVCQQALRSLKNWSELVEEEGFWMTRNQLSNRRSATAVWPRPPYSAPTCCRRAKIRTAARIARRENGGLSDDEMAMAIARLLGSKTHRFRIKGGRDECPSRVGFA